MSPDRVIYMASQIGKFFQSQGHDKAVPGIAEHIRQFWNPRMCSAIALGTRWCRRRWPPVCQFSRRSAHRRASPPIWHATPTWPCLASCVRGGSKSIVVRSEFALRLDVQRSAVWHVSCCSAADRG